MLHLFFAVAFSAAPLILYVPPIRSLNLFLEAVQDMWRETSGHTVRVYPRLRQKSVLFSDALLFPPRYIGIVT
ncbi:hypothetical protein Sango_1544200 [Sesamum angolense]|uniref:Uncharacterized protein n=1 Tax=Sesamum angolense TaxID=2727404 RepID=A0AAE1WPD5_9LAMI|nr:hypothetical protein Sango_1544200 [Sesamum angolense]